MNATNYSYIILCELVRWFYSNLGFIFTGSVGNSRSSTQMNSYSDSGYQEIGSFHNSQNLNKSDIRQQHSLGGPSNNHVMRSSRAEGQTSVQVLWAVHCTCGCARASTGFRDSSCIARPPFVWAGVNVTKLQFLFNTFTGYKARTACSWDSFAGISTCDLGQSQQLNWSSTPNCTAHCYYHIKKVSLTQNSLWNGGNLLEVSLYVSIVLKGRCYLCSCTFYDF